MTSKSPTIPQLSQTFRGYYDRNIYTAGFITDTILHNRKYSATFQNNFFNTNQVLKGGNYASPINPNFSISTRKNLNEKSKTIEIVDENYSSTDNNSNGIYTRSKNFSQRLKSPIELPINLENVR